MELYYQQQKALAAISDFISNDKAIFVLAGYAGTGKTTLISPIISLAEKAGKTVKLMAPTGRAAKIVSDKTKFKATTIHSAIYKFSKIETVQGSEGSATRIEYHFPLRSQTDQINNITIVDEASMISAKKSLGEMFVFGSGVLLDDLLTFAQVKEGGKVIFIGDPAQLPPVGDPNSMALDTGYLRTLGYGVDSYELNEVIRQEAGSSLLSNSLKLRSLICSDKRTELVLERKQGETEDIQEEDIADKFHELSPSPNLYGPVVICFSNKSAAAYNRSVRSRYFSDTSSVQVGDRLIVVGNNYSATRREVLNGEFAIIIEKTDVTEKQEGFIYVDDGTGKKIRKKFALLFRNVTLQFEDGETFSHKIFESLLESNRPNLSYQEQCALISNFRIRHKGLKENSDEFLNALWEDEYVNALRVKYGYAITCHKAQGGEWDNVFVDFYGRTGLSTDCLRWSYTAITRAKKRLFGNWLHNIPALTARIMDITSISKVSDEYYPADSDVPAGPFCSTSDKVTIKAKYWQVAEAIEGSCYRIIGIDHMKYREAYTLSDDEGNIFRFDAVYNEAGMMKPFTSAIPGNETKAIVEMINNVPDYNIPYHYEPCNQYLKELYEKIRSACDSCEIKITNIVEHICNYKVSYYLKTDAAFALLEVFINKSGQVTNISPRSETGTADSKLAELVNELKG